MAVVIITVANLKGGTGKTTTSVLLALGLQRVGRTLLIDADPQASAYRWSEDADDFPVPVMPWASRELTRRLRQVRDDYRYVVIDTAPQHDALVRQALLVTDLLLTPLAPSPVEAARLTPTLELSAEVQEQQPHRVAVLLTRVRAGTRSARAVRGLLADRGVPLLETAISLREAFATAYGSVPDRLGEYGRLAEEVLQLEQDRSTPDPRVAALDRLIGGLG